MKFGTLKRISKEAMSRAGDVPKWVDALLEPLNDFIENVGLALQGRLTFDENFLCKIVTREFSDGVEIEINPSLENQKNLRAYGVIPLSMDGLSFDKFGWVQKPNGNIGVTFDLDGGSSATCTILILLR